MYEINFSHDFFFFFSNPIKYYYYRWPQATTSTATILSPFQKQNKLASPSKSFLPWVNANIILKWSKKYCHYYWYISKSLPIIIIVYILAFYKVNTCRYKFKTFKIRIWICKFGLYSAKIETTMLSGLARAKGVNGTCTRG